MHELICVVIFTLVMLHRKQVQQLYNCVVDGTIKIDEGKSYILVLRDLSFWDIR